MKPSYMPKSGKQGTPTQDHAWGAFGGASSGWGDLTEEQYRAWDAAAKEENRRRHLSKGHRLNGQNLFTKINGHQDFLGLPRYSDPPEYPAFGLALLGPLMADEGVRGVTLKLGVPRRPAGYVLVYGARPRRRGQRYCDKFSYLGLLPAPKGRVSELTALYCLRVGAPPPGSRVIIVTRQQVNGWRGLPMRFDVIIPGGHAPAAPPKRRQATAGA